MKRTVLLSLGVLLLTACASAPPKPSAGSDEAAVARASDNFWAIRDRGEASTFAALFTDDGIFMVPGLADASGMAAVQEMAAKRFAAAKAIDFEIHRREITVAGNTAHELGWFSETLPTPDEWMRMEGHYLLVWQRGHDGVWRVHRYMYNFSGAKPTPSR
jgi:uncharacterized protein (TIGR02246 family)